MVNAAVEVTFIQQEVSVVAWPIDLTVMETYRKGVFILLLRYRNEGPFGALLIGDIIFIISFIMYRKRKNYINYVY